MFSRTSTAAAKYKEASLMEAVKTAELYLEVDMRLPGNEGKKDIDTLVQRVIELAGGNEDEYIIIYGKLQQLANISQKMQKTQVLAKKMQLSQTEGNKIQEVTIIHKPTGVIIEITIDENNSVTVESRIDETVIKREIPTIVYTINPEEPTKASEVTITITAKEEKNGITKIKFPDNTEKTYSNQKIVTATYQVAENGRYKFEVTGADGTKVAKVVEIKNVNSAGDISITIQNLQPTNRSVNVVIRYDENPTINGQLLTNADKYQYKIGDGNWVTATNPITISVAENCAVYARYYDGSTGYKTQTISVGNIDNVAPYPFALMATATSNSITVSGSTLDTASEGAAASTAGIKGYQYKIDDMEWQPAEPTQESSYTFTNLVQGSTHTVNMRAIDKAGNVRVASNNSSSVNVQNTTVVDSATNIACMWTPEEATNGGVVVTLENTSTVAGLTIEYRIGDGDWYEYTNPITMEENGIIYARLKDSVNQVSSGTTLCQINNIDTICPASFELQATATSNSITVSGTTTDRGSEGCAAEFIGISRYQYQLKDSSGIVMTDWVSTTAASYTFIQAEHGIVSGKTYKVNMKAIDLAGNEKVANNELTITLK